MQALGITANPDTPALTGPGYSSGIAGDGPKRKPNPKFFCNSETGSKKTTVINKFFSNRLTTSSACKASNSGDFELAPDNVSGDTRVSQFLECNPMIKGMNMKHQGAISTQQTPFNGTIINNGCEESKDCGEPLQVANVAQHGGFSKIKRIVTGMFNESDDLEALCNDSLNLGAETTGHESLTEGQLKMIRLVCNILMHSDLVPRLVYTALSTYSEGCAASQVGGSLRPQGVSGLYSEAAHTLVHLTPPLARALCDWGEVAAIDDAFFRCLLMATGHFSLNKASDLLTLMQAQDDIAVADRIIRIRDGEGKMLADLWVGSETESESTTEEDYPDPVELPYDQQMGAPGVVCNTDLDNPHDWNSPPEHPLDKVAYKVGSHWMAQTARKSSYSRVIETSPQTLKHCY